MDPFFEWDLFYLSVFIPPPFPAKIIDFMSIVISPLFNNECSKDK